MRTTLTLDPDVEQLLRRAMREHGGSFKQTVNQAIRKGLAGTDLAEDQGPYTVPARELGLRPGIDPVDMQALTGELEAEAFQRLVDGGS